MSKIPERFSFFLKVSEEYYKHFYAYYTSTYMPFILKQVEVKLSLYSS